MIVIVSSLFLGSSGKIQVLGIPIEFKKGQTAFLDFSNNLFGQVANNLLKNRAFNILTFGYLHTFVHEMGHALAANVICNVSSKIEILTSNLSGCTFYNARGAFSPIESSFISLAGPLADVIFSVSQIFAAFALSPYITLPVATAIAFTASIWIFGEAFYAIDSLLTNNNGDFAQIARNGFSHLIVATSIMVGILALGIFATKRIL